MEGETELEMAERHVREGEAIVARQVALIQRLCEDGQDTLAAEQLLALFQKSLALHYEQLANLQPADKS